MTEFWKRLRHRIAYWLASDWIDDLEYRLGAFLFEQTGGRLSKSNYTVEAMVSAANDYQQRLCDECRQEAASEEVKRLKAEHDALIRNYKECAMEAVRDFAERLENKLPPRDSDYCVPEYRQVLFYIDRVVEEMEGDYDVQDC